MLTENKMFTPEEEKGISQTADALVELLGEGLKEWPAVARSWAKRMAKFSERPIRVEPTDSIDGSLEAKRFSLTVSGRDLNLDFDKSHRIIIRYFDGNLRQTSEISPWTNIIAEWVSNPDSLFIYLENGGSVGIIKENGTVTLKSFPGR